MSGVPERDVIVIGGSAGCNEPLKQILRALPRDLPAVVCVVVHVPPDAPHELVKSMADVGGLPATIARNGEAPEIGHVYVAPPDHHLLLRTDELCVTRGPHENRARPAIDPTLRTAANVFGGRVTAVILSGNLNDGTYGAMVVKARGGTVIAQDPAEAAYSSMPQSIVDHSLADHVLETAEIGPRLVSLVWSALPDDLAHAPTRVDPGPDELERVSSGLELPAGELSPMTCPECAGPLWLKQDGSLSRYRCHTGHAFTGETLLAAQEQDLEGALWSAVRALDEHAALNVRLADQAKALAWGRRREHYLQRAKDIESSAELIRNRLLL